MPKTKRHVQKRTFLGNLVYQSVPQYLITGLVVFYSDYLIFWIGYRKLALGLVVAQAFAYIVGVVVNFVMERYWVFERISKGESAQKETPRYVVVLITNYLITVALLEILESFGISAMWGKYFVAFFFTFYNYVIFRFWVFKAPRRKLVRRKTNKS